MNLTTAEFTDRRAISGALAVLLATLLAFTLHLDDPWWAAVTAFKLCMRDRDAEFQLAFLRFAGTIGGAIVGVLVASQLTTIPAAQVMAMGAVAGFSTYKFLTTTHAYAWLLGGITAVIILGSAIETSAELLEFAVFRTLEVCTGLVAVLVMDSLVLPWTPQQPAVPKQALSALDRAAILRAAIVAGSVAMLIPVIWMLLQLPSLAQVLVSTFAIINRDFASTFRKGLLRIRGVLVGGGLGLIVIGLTMESFVLWCLLFVLGMTLAVGAESSGQKDSYMGYQAGFGFIVAMVTTNGPPDTIVPILDRILGIGFGIAIASVVYTMVGALLPLPTAPALHEPLRNEHPQSST